MSICIYKYISRSHLDYLSPENDEQGEHLVILLKECETCFFIFLFLSLNIYVLITGLLGRFSKFTLFIDD